MLKNNSQVTISISQLTKDKIIEKNIESWPIWSCEISEFPWTYGQKETCLILEGEIIVTTETERVTIHSGDYVIFPKGLSCHWNVLKPVRKYHSFG